MIQIIRDGNKKQYIHKCRKCDTVFSYQYSDTYEEVEEDKEEIDIKNDTLQNFNINTSICNGFNNIDASLKVGFLETQVSVDNGICNTLGIDPSCVPEMRLRALELERIRSMCQETCIQQEADRLKSMSDCVNVYKNRKKNERYCICPSCAEENEVEFTKKTMSSFLKLVM